MAERLKNITFDEITRDVMAMLERVVHRREKIMVELADGELF